MTSELVLVEQKNEVIWITINRPERRNALNEEVVLLIRKGLADAQANPACRAVVLTGAHDRAFCAGADLAKGVKGAAFDVDYSNPTHYLVALLREMETCSLPLLARVNGHVMAGGMGLLCACDMAVAADDVRCGTPESKIGLFPMMILPHLLRVIGQRKLREMCITGEPIDAAEARSLGLFNYVVPRAELDTTLQWLLARTIDKSPTSIRIGKQALRAMGDMNLSLSLEYAQAMLPSMASTWDAKEGLAAFQEKRPPQWSGK